MKYSSKAKLLEVLLFISILASFPSLVQFGDINTKDSCEMTKTMPKVVVSNYASKLATAVRDLAGGSGNEIFTVAVSGGSLPKYLFSGLDGLEGVDYSKWRIFLADERYVPLDHEDSNYKLAVDELTSKLGISNNQIYPINPNIPLEKCAEDYEDRVLKAFRSFNKVTPDGKLPVFDLILLGMGPDGHTCSLFPGHKLLDETLKVVAPIDDSPKPPPRRVTLTYPVLSAAKKAFFVCNGSGKKNVLPEVIVSAEELKQLGTAALPAARVRLSKPEDLVWYIDDAAAVNLELA